MVLVRPDEDHRPLLLRKRARTGARLRRGRLETEEAHEVVGAGGRSAADEEQLVGVLGAVRVALEVLLDHLARLRHELARLSARLRGERVLPEVRGAARTCEWQTCLGPARLGFCLGPASLGFCLGSARLGFCLGSASLGLEPSVAYSVAVRR